MEGMQTFDGELEKMIRCGTITKEIGLAYASNANNLALAITDLNGGNDSTAANSEVEIEMEGFEK